MFEKQKQYFLDNVVPIQQAKLLSMAHYPASKILDIGCWDGQFTAKFAAKVGASEVYGVDTNKAALIQAEKKGIKCVFADANKPLPFDAAYFDAVLMNQVLEHMVDPDACIQEVNRVLKMGAVYIYRCQISVLYMSGFSYCLAGNRQPHGQVGIGRLAIQYMAVVERLRTGMRRNM